MSCISSTQYTFLVNRDPSNIFQPKRGLHQGDPMSPMLFVIGMEYLSRMLTVAGLNDSFRFHPRCRKLKLNHLCFSEDLMLFSKGDSNSIKLLCDCLDKFAMVSGLYANKSNSTIYLASLPQPLRDPIVV